MKKLAAIVTVAALFAFVLGPASAQQDGKKKDGPPDGQKKGPPPPGKEGGKKEEGKKEVKCGKDAGACADELRRHKDLSPDEIDTYVKVHFKLNHPDGCCHCFCGHKPPPDKIGGGDGGGEKKKPGPGDGGGEKKPPPKDGDGDKKKCGCDQCHCCNHDAPFKKPGGGDGGEKKKPGPGDGGGEKKPPPKDGDGDKKKCGCDPETFCDELKKRGFGKDECERKTKEHFKNHPDGICHCFCGHDDDGKKDGGGKGGKGNNGVGNGQDPQPPGKPPVNDGPGTGPGNPGNKKGGGEGKK